MQKSWGPLLEVRMLHTGSQRLQVRRTQKNTLPDMPAAAVLLETETTMGRDARRLFIGKMMPPKLPVCPCCQNEFPDWIQEHFAKSDWPDRDFFVHCPCAFGPLHVVNDKKGIVLKLGSNLLCRPDFDLTSVFEKAASSVTDFCHITHYERTSATEYSARSSNSCLRVSGKCRVLIGPFRRDEHFQPDCGASRVRNCSSEEACVMYLFNRWPSMRIAPFEQIHRDVGQRIIVWVWENDAADSQSPCAAVAGEGYKPNWDIWKPYMERASCSDQSKP